ncbi:hypothetical protein KAH27_00975 [bacterium]|nr:hypothetical protein [bacterium]
MKTKTDCIPCVFKQSLTTIRHVTNDEEIIEGVMKKIAGIYSKKSLQTTPAYFSQATYEIISKEIGKNIYFILKAKCQMVANELGVSIGDSVLTKKR